MARSKNNPSNRNKQEVQVRKCEFCDGTNTHSVMISKLTGIGNKRKKRMVWACKEDSCPRFK